MAIMGPVYSRKPATWQNRSCVRVLRIKNVPANHAKPSLEYTFLRCADNPTGPLPNRSAFNLKHRASSSSDQPTSRLFISPESPVLCLHLLVKPCQFFRLGFTC